MAQHSRNLGSAQLLAERMARRPLMWGARTLTSISFAEAMASGDRAFLLILLENPGSHRSRERRFTLAFTGGDAFGILPASRCPELCWG
jgi:hypothetical protein